MKNATTNLWRDMHEMASGQSIVVSFDEYAYRTARTYASELGLKLGCRFSTRLDRENRQYTITRE